MTITITLVIIVITCLVSLAGFNSQKVLNDLIFYPPAVTYDKQWYRFFSCGLIHADFFHLLFNMYALYLFGQGVGNLDGVERYFVAIFGGKGKLLYVLLYVSALGVCLLPTYMRHKTDSAYRSLGASGAVSAVIFAYIMINPLQGMGILFVPGIYLPGFLFGLIYLVISSFLDRRGKGNINHSAHIWGALYGIVFLVISSALFSDYPVLSEFISKIKGYLESL